MYLFRDKGNRYADRMIDLQNASRDDLIRLIITQHERIMALEAVVVEQRAVIATLEATVTQLTQRVGELLARLDAGADDAPPGRPQGMPGLKPTTGKARPPKQPRKGREQQFVRQRVERCCPHCHMRHTPAVDLGAAVVGRQRFGVRLVSLIATLREEARLPVATIQWYLQTFHALSISVGAIVGASQQMARAGAATVEAIREEIRGSRVAHLDETGWREDGVNGYVWTCSTLDAQYFARGSREGKMVDALLGDDFAGVLVSDFYVGYQHYPGVKQKCWAHLLRDVHDLRVAHPKDADVQAWAAGVHDLYVRAVAWKEAHAVDGKAARQQAERMFMAALQMVYAPYCEAAVPQRVLSARMAKHLHELFVFVREPEVPPDNNAAERALRHLVTSRKISGGTRSAAGSATKMTLASLFGTWRTRGENPFTACRALLVSPQP